MLMTNVTIRKNRKFTTAALGCFLRLPLTRHNLAFASLLARMQINFSLLFPNISLQQKKLAELYDLQLEIIPQLFGKEIILSYYANFIEPVEVLDPDYNYQNIIKTVGDIITKPYCTPEGLNFAQRQLEVEYQELMQQPSNYAIERFFKLWYRDQPDYADNFMGPIAEIKSATVQEMQQYIASLREVPMAVVGMARDNKLVGKLAKSCFNSAGILKDFQIDNLTIPAVKNYLEKVDQQDNVQAQLLMGYGFAHQITYQDQITGLLLSQYLAGDQSSKLFSQIREELGAAYDVGASCFANNSLFLVNAGLDPSQVAAAKQIILDEVNRIAQGEIDAALFKKAKKALQRNNKIGLDNQNWQLAQALRGELLPGYLDFDREAAIKTTTPQKMIRFAQNLFLNESYVLK